MANEFEQMLSTTTPEVHKLMEAVQQQQVAGREQYRPMAMMPRTGGNRTVTVNNQYPQALSGSVEADRVRRQQLDMDSRQQALTGVDPGMQQWAPLAGILKGLAANMQRGVDDVKLEDLYAQVEASEAQRVAQEAQQAAQVKAEQRAYSEKQATLEHQRGIEAEAAKQAAIAANRAPTAPQAPTVQEKVAAIKAANLGPEQEREQMLMVAPALVADGDAADSAHAATQADIGELLRIKTELDRAEELQRAGTAYLTGPMAGRLPHLSDTAQELNQLYTGLGLDRLSELKGSSSDKEMDVSFSAGPTMKKDTSPNLKAIERQKNAVNNRLRQLGYSEGGGRQIVRTGIKDGRKVVQYSDGTVEYAQ